jgi:hypoxanthine phosphoribosyltransferase
MKKELKEVEEEISSFIKNNNLEKEKYTTIIAISMGGNFIAECFASLLKAQIVYLPVSRPDRKSVYKNIFPFSKNLAHFVYEILFILDSPEVKSVDILPYLHGEKILVVDDAIHTGKTKKVVERFLHKNGVKKYTWFFYTILHNKNKDLHIHTQKILFPWSKNNT